MRFWLRKRKRPSEREFVAEIESHIAHETDDQIERGTAPAQARYAAIRHFGNITRHLERFREASPWFWLDVLRQDLRYSWRSLKRTPALFCAVVVTLALAIGGSTTLSSVFYMAVIDPLPFPDGDRLATLVQYDRERAGAPGTTYVHTAEFGEYARLSMFSAVAGIRSAMARISPTEGPAILVLHVTCNFFDVLRVEPLLGRAPRVEDCSPTATPVVVLSHRVWVSRFGADPSVIGRSVGFTDALGVAMPPFATVIGVMPARVRYLRQDDAWLPSPVNTSDSSRMYGLLARLRDGVPYSQAKAGVAAVAASLVAAAPADHAHDRGPYGLERVYDQKTRPYRGTMTALAAGTASILIIACVNIATLLLARTVARRTEIAVRVSIGASAGRIMRQFMIEGLLVTGCGSIVGILASAALMPFLARLVTTAGVIPPEVDLRLNGPGLLAAAAVVLAMTFVFGLVPSVYALRRAPTRAVIGNTRMSADSSGRRWRAAIIAAQVAVGFPVFCVAAGQVLSLNKLERGVQHYHADQILEVRAGAPADRREQDLLAAESAIAALPGVMANGSLVPILPYATRPVTLSPGLNPAGPRWTAQVRCASPGLFTALDLPLLSGRTFDSSDVSDRRRVTVISRSFAHASFGDTNPVGRHVNIIDAPQSPCDPGRGPLEIIGVVNDLPLLEDRPLGPAITTVPTVFLPRSLASPPVAQILVRTAVPPQTIRAAVAAALSRVDPALTFDINGVLQESIREEWMNWPGLIAGVGTSFAVVGAALVLVGLFGVLSYSIAQLTRELGIRIALGASPRQIGRRVLGQGLRWTLVGVVAGGVLIVPIQRVAVANVWGVEALNVSVFESVAAMILLVAALTAWGPARRAMRVDPILVLRAD